MKSGEIGPRDEDTGDLGLMLVVFKPAVNNALTPRSVVSNFATFDRQSSICSLFPHPVLTVPHTSKVSEYAAYTLYTFTKFSAIALCGSGRAPVVEASPWNDK